MIREPGDLPSSYIKPSDGMCRRREKLMPLWQEAACHDDMPECASTRHYSSIHSRHPTRLLTATLGFPFASESRGVAFQRAAGISHIATANSPWHSRIVQTARMFGVATDDTVLACDPVNGEYRQPLLRPAQPFHLVQNWPYDVFVAAWQQGITTRPILLGPVSFLALCGMTKEDNIGQGLMRLLPAYIECLEQLTTAGCLWVQIDEPVLAHPDLSAATLTHIDVAWRILAEISGVTSLVLVGGEGGFGPHLPFVLQLPFDGLHIDLVHGYRDLPYVLKHFPADRWLSLGLVDACGMAPTHIGMARTIVDQILNSHRRDRLMIAPSGALGGEAGLNDTDVTVMLRQKMSEIVSLAASRQWKRQTEPVREFCENDIRFVPCAADSVRH
ncbi:uroporphyrinogen decarboxylase/cobalamine-independent methonine synthase family protein [Komagataeibacter diospyri]|uniref:5-methyltetrahydropteroyltriglutamate/ homocysteine S-methyltransferase n=1 Tax=Komagataeibacter diospyri TaxID=1932662 RepID=A0A4P5NPI4_9PROT|nr:5-methyltetrahydropteroyltriglutamate--homocysteine methyltransferase [Komagataeibacter diospyri]GCE83538.1 5- methyltetrahydropteroyltriglutamate/ homocysteine S-methyltransferase [Komagataeibacter diospyri]